MNIVNSTEYYAARERRERDLAAGATSPAIAAIHREMADRYAELLPLNWHLKTLPILEGASNNDSTIK